jgi:hypothetical protein
MVMPMDVVERFEDKVLPEPTSGCHLWIGAIASNGYGNFSLGGRDQKTWKAHRTAWELYRGVIPNGACVLHRCDVPSCVNPNHLFLGTQATSLL